MQLYLIPGLGFDQRIFDNLSFLNHQVHYLNWLEPHKRETLSDYALRMGDTIDQSSGQKVLIGHSFGGVLCQEIAKTKKVDKIILLSSIKSREENPLHFRALPYWLIKLIFTKQLTFASFPLWAKTHGYNTPELKELFHSMIDGYSNHYLQWALNQLANWQSSGKAISYPLIHIHGTADKTFPFKLIKGAHHIIDDGSHIMLFKKADMIQAIIDQELGQL